MPNSQRLQWHGMGLGGPCDPAIYALSPQVNRRIKKLFGTSQDRLIAELHSPGITTPLWKKSISYWDVLGGL